MDLISSRGGDREKEDCLVGTLKGGFPFSTAGSFEAVGVTLESPRRGGVTVLAGGDRERSGGVMLRVCFWNPSCPLGFGGDSGGEVEFE